MNGSEKLPPWYDWDKHEVDPDTGIVKKKGYNIVRGKDVVKMGEKLVMEKIARVEKETKEKEKKKK